MSLSFIQRSAWLAALLLVASLAHGAPPKSILVGTLNLKFCNEDYQGYCGSIKRPLDPTGGIKGTINVGFEYYPRHDQSAPGPRHDAAAGRRSRVFLALALATRTSTSSSRCATVATSLIVDKRGTGTSGAINCQKIQTGDPNDPAGLKACANQLGAKAWLYGTTLAVGDIVAVLDALQIDEVDYYGDSYGTYVGQVFAACYPNRLRSIILDSAYPVRAPDVWFPTDWATGRNGLDLVCMRSPSCRVLGGKSTARIEALLKQLRRKPITALRPIRTGYPPKPRWTCRCCFCS